jgi:hypothetical protein
MLGGSSGEKLDGANGIAIGILLGFIAVAGIIMIAGALVGGVIGHALYRFDIWRSLKLGGKLGGVFGVLVVTPLAIHLGSAAWAAIDGNLGKSLVGDLVTLMVLLLGFTLAMDTLLVVGFGVGAATGHLIHRSFAPNVRQSIG